MITALLLFLSSTIWGSTTFLLIAGIWKLKEFKTINLKTPLFRVICIICILSVLNFIISLLINAGQSLHESSGLIGNYPYALSMFVSYVLAVTIQPKELKYLLYLIIIDVFVGIIEYTMGVSSFWVSDLTFDADTELLYYKRSCGLDTNSSILAMNVIIGLIITYILKPKHKLFIISVLCVGLFVSFNRSYILASIPLLLYFILSSSHKNKLLVSLTLISMIVLGWYVIQTYGEMIINQFSRGSANSSTFIMSNRDVLWRDFMNFFYQHPILGNGSSKLWLDNGMHAHNSFIWVLSSNGLVIACLYYYYTFRYINKYNWILIMTIIIGSITQSTIYWGLSLADIFLFIVIANTNISSVSDIKNVSYHN